MRVCTAIVWLLCLADYGFGASAAPMPEPQTDTRYEKLGEARFVYKRLFKVYDATLFVEPGTAATAILSGDSGIELRFHYRRAIDKALAIEQANAALQRNLSSEQLALVREPLAQLHRAYRSVKKGDTTRIVYQPTVGTSYYHNGERLITLAGRDFAPLYFQIWLGDAPISPELRDSLLGRTQTK